MNATEPDVRRWLDETLQRFPVPTDETVDRVAALLRSAPERVPATDTDPDTDGGGPG